ncbi:MAG: PAS domain S-box protein, partial [Bacteroidota bacterium]
MRFLGRYKTVYRILKSDNTYIWFETLGRSIKDEKGSIIQIQTTSRDITQPQEALQRLHSSESQLKSIFEATVNTYILIDENCIVLNFNRAAASFVQEVLNKELFQGANWLDYKNPKDILRFKKDVQKAFQGREVMDIRQIQVNGQARWFEVQILPTYSHDAKIRAVAFITLDISEKKNSELRLTNSELEFRALLNATSQQFFLIGKNYRILRFNQMAHQVVKETFGKDIREGDSILWYTDPSQILELKKNVQKAFQGEVVRTNQQLRYGTHALRWYACEFFPSYNDNEEIFAVTFTILDINDKKEAEINLARSEADFQALFNASDRQFY